MGQVGRGSAWTLTTVSVAIPCYNGGRYLAATIESLLVQSRPADEVLVVDDGSTDDSLAIAARYPVRLVRHEANRGLAVARNTALASAQSDILAFVDVDATADPALLAVLLSGYDEPDVGGVGGQGIESQIMSTADRWRRAHATQGHGQQQKDVQFLFGLCMSFRVTVLRELAGFNETFKTNAEDVDMGLRVNAAGYRLRYFPQARVYHQRTDDEASLKRAMINWRVAGYRARRLNGNRAWMMHAGTLRRIVTNPLHDLAVDRSLAMAMISWRIGWSTLGALWRASSTFAFQ
jgi:glycosyltransferase involved in cell wall biosynthesis